MSKRDESINYQKEYNIRSGKVRDIWDVGYGKLAMVHSNRISAFDRHLADVPGKGSILTATSAWWFHHTQDIIPNHLVYAKNNVMIVKKCEVIPIEVVIRAYITGSTQTSLWTHYSQGERNYCGIEFPDGLTKNQKLDQVVITPTTKGEVDIPISAKEIVQSKICTQQEWDFITQKALELFEFGSSRAAQAGYILVDTKLEFGRTPRGEIILIDEIFTCDSSRYWLQSSYEAKMKDGLAPESLDKDIIRHYVKSQCDPYQDPIPDIPPEIINQVSQAYMTFYQQLIQQSPLPSELDPGIRSEMMKDREVAHTIAMHFHNFHNPFVLVLSGSSKDEAHVSKIIDALEERQIYCRWEVCSAHKETSRLLSLIEDYMDDVSFNNRKMAIVCVAGMSNALGAVVACNTNIPVISCPPLNYDNYMIDIHSSLRNPSNVPVSVILNPANCAQYLARWFHLVGWL